MFFKHNEIFHLTIFKEIIHWKHRGLTLPIFTEYHQAYKTLRVKLNLRI